MRLSVLIDAGSMKTILSRDACQLISDGCIRCSESPPTFRANSSQCVSVTGQPSSSSSLIVAHVVFPGSNCIYEELYQADCHNYGVPYTARYTQCVQGA